MYTIKKKLECTDSDQ